MNPICIGTDAFTSGCATNAYFNGSVDDVAVWNTAIGYYDIQKIYLRQSCNEAPVPQASKLAGLWHLDEPTPNMSISNFIDQSANANNLSNSGSIYGSDGKFGFAPTFTSDPTYLYKNSPAGLPTSGSKTLAAWFKTTASTTCSSTACNIGGFGENTTGLNFQVGVYSNQFVVYGWGSDWTTGVSASGFMDTGWHHIAITYAAGSPNTTKIYLDGVLKATSTVNTFNTKPTYLVIGQAIHKTSMTFPGKIDEFAIWSTDLSSSEVANLFNRARPLPTP
ncbi:MAG: LamG domain-containing protein [Proteobacteria bacterium]|nr:MAG: LamG domain-containing protein [Pseudomonadota bacterium]